MKFYTPLATFLTSDGGECNVRDYAGQSGRFCVIGPYTTDIMGSFRTLAEAKRYVEKRFGPGSWDRAATDAKDGGGE